VGGWLTRWEFERIASTGSGGIRRVGAILLSWSDATVAGLVAGALVLTLGIVLSRHPARPHDHEQAPTRGPSTQLAIVLLLVVSVGSVAVMVRTVETVTLSVIPIGGAMAEELPPDPPARLIELRSVPASERGGRLTRDIQVVTWGGLVLACLLSGLAIAARRVDWDGSVARRVLPTVAVMLVFAAGWTGVRLWSTSTWLRALVFDA